MSPTEHTTRPASPRLSELTDSAVDPFVRTTLAPSGETIGQTGAPSAASHQPRTECAGYMVAVE